MLTTRVKQRLFFAFLVTIVTLWLILVSSGLGFTLWLQIFIRFSERNSTINNFYENESYARSQSELNDSEPGRISLNFFNVTNISREAVVYDDFTENGGSGEVYTVPGSTNEKWKTTDAELTYLSQIMWERDKNRQSDIIIDNKRYRRSPQQYSNSSRFFKSVNDTSLRLLPTYAALIELFDNYNSDVYYSESETKQEKEEVESFLNKIVETEPIKVLHSFFLEKGILEASVDSLKTALRGLWFRLYSRSVDSELFSSCGFEHVFLGEQRQTRTLGLHNWVRYYLAESTNLLVHNGIVDKSEPSLVSVHFTWRQRKRKRTSFLVGPSPEFEIALFTLCAVARPNEECLTRVNNGSYIEVMTKMIGSYPDTSIATAYPILQ